MAGVFGLDYATFIRFNTLGILIGIGQFIVVGYFFGANLPSILDFRRFAIIVAFLRRRLRPGLVLVETKDASALLTGPVRPAFSR